MADRKPVCVTLTDELAERLRKNINALKKVMPKDAVVQSKELPPVETYIAGESGGTRSVHDRIAQLNEEIVTTRGMAHPNLTSAAKAIFEKKIADSEAEILSLQDQITKGTESAPSPEGPTPEEGSAMIKKSQEAARSRVGKSAGEVKITQGTPAETRAKRPTEIINDLLAPFERELGSELSTGPMGDVPDELRRAMVDKTITKMEEDLMNSLFSLKTVASEKGGHWFMKSPLYMKVAEGGLSRGEIRRAVRDWARQARGRAMESLSHADVIAGDGAEATAMRPKKMRLLESTGESFPKASRYDILTDAEIADIAKSPMTTEESETFSQWRELTTGENPVLDATTKTWDDFKELANGLPYEDFLALNPRVYPFIKELNQVGVGRAEDSLASLQKNGIFPPADESLNKLGSLRERYRKESDPKLKQKLKESLSIAEDEQRAAQRVSDDFLRWHIGGDPESFARLKVAFEKSIDPDFFPKSVREGLVESPEGDPIRYRLENQRGIKTRYNELKSLSDRSLPYLQRLQTTTENQKAYKKTLDNWTPTAEESSTGKVTSLEDPWLAAEITEIYNESNPQMDPHFRIREAKSILLGKINQSIKDIGLDASRVQMLGALTDSQRKSFSAQNKDTFLRKKTPRVVQRGPEVFDTKNDVQEMLLNSAKKSRKRGQMGLSLVYEMVDRNIQHAIDQEYSGGVVASPGKSAWAMENIGVKDMFAERPSPATERKYKPSDDPRKVVLTKPIHLTKFAKAMHERFPIIKDTSRIPVLKSDSPEMVAQIKELQAIIDALPDTDRVSLYDSLKPTTAFRERPLKNSFSNMITEIETRNDPVGAALFVADPTGSRVNDYLNTANDEYLSDHLLDIKTALETVDWIGHLKGGRMSPTSMTPDERAQSAVARANRKGASSKAGLYPAEPNTYGENASLQEKRKALKQDVVNALSEYADVTDAEVEAIAEKFMETAMSQMPKEGKRPAPQAQPNISTPGSLEEEIAAQFQGLSGYTKEDVNTSELLPSGESATPLVVDPEALKRGEHPDDVKPIEEHYGGYGDDHTVPNPFSREKTNLYEITMASFLDPELSQFMTKYGEPVIQGTPTELDVASTVAKKFSSYLLPEIQQHFDQTELGLVKKIFKDEGVNVSQGYSDDSTSAQLEKSLAQKDLIRKGAVLPGETLVEMYDMAVKSGEKKKAPQEVMRSLAKQVKETQTQIIAHLWAERMGRSTPAPDDFKNAEDIGIPPINRFYSLGENGMIVEHKIEQDLTTPGVRATVVKNTRAGLPGITRENLGERLTTGRFAPADVKRMKATGVVPKKYGGGSRLATDPNPDEKGGLKSLPKKVREKLREGRFKAPGPDPDAEKSRTPYDPEWLTKILKK